MKKVFSLIVVVCMLAVMTGCSVVSRESYDILYNDWERLKQENEELQEETHSLHDQNEELQEEVEALTNRANVLQFRIESLQEEARSVTTDSVSENESSGNQNEEPSTNDGIADETSSSSASSLDVEPSGVAVPGEPMSPGEQINLSEVIFEYVKTDEDGSTFKITNESSDIVRIIVDIVGVKADGSYASLQSPGLFWRDEYAYEKDLDENGWAVPEYTNMLRPGESVTAVIEVFEFHSFDELYPEPDIDGDGYYDILFTVSPQVDEDTITFSTTDPRSETYKIPVE